MTENEIKKNLSDLQWRLDNLYFIIDKNGKRVLFNMNDSQRELFDDMHYRNIILKARQLGFTTFIMIFMLDAALFNDNTRCAVIAHNKDDASRLFREKIKFAYDNLVSTIREMMPAKSDRAGEMVFNNGSSITVGTSFRGGTLKYLHISEFGKICAKYPEKAKEIVTGAFEAVGSNGVISIESTAEGRQGYFYDYCSQAEKDLLRNKTLSALDFKFFFFAWYQDSSYQLDSTEELPQRLIEYFYDLEQKHNIKLSYQQKQWYYAKEKILGDDIKREYPTTTQEAFEQTIEGAYYAAQFRKLYENKQITSVPCESGALVHTFWDLGYNDSTTIWFIQQIGREYRVINYYENHSESLAFYIAKIKEIGEQESYHYGQHVAPHDIGVHEYSTGMTRLEQAKQLGINFDVAAKLSIADGIDAVRSVLTICWFDESKCEKGIAHLQNYHKEWDDKYGVWKSKPAHDEASHGADAFRVFAVSIRELQNKMSATNYFREVEQVDQGMWV